ncbi:MAG: Lrp/AsnC family transcriptional regulator [Candidatus Diapherotrites archaeon]
MELERLDRQILFELDFDSRQTNKEIAKKCRISEQVVAYRVNRMIQNGTIEYFYALVNGAKLGLMCFRIYLRLQSLSPEIESQIRQSILKNSYTIWLVSVRGKYDMLFAMYAKSIEQFSDLFNSITKDFDQYISNKNICVVEEAQAFGRNHLVGKKSEKEISLIYGGSPKEHPLDSLDFTLLSNLSKGGRIPTTELAKVTGINGETIRYRLKKLVKAGVVLGFRALPDLKKVGYLKYVISLRLFSATAKRKRELAGFCREHPNVLFLVKCIGDHEIDLEIEVEKESDFDSLLNGLKKNFNDIIRDYEILSISGEHKFNYFDLKSL